MYCRGGVFSLIQSDYKFRFELTFLAAFIPASLILPFVKSKFLAVFILLMFCFMELVQFCHYFYYNSPLNVFSLHLMFSELNEIFESASVMLDKGGIIVVLMVLIPYTLLIVLYIKIKRNTNYIASILIIILLLILPHKAIFKTPSLRNFMPRNDSVSLLNSLKTFTAYFCLYLPNNDKGIKKYKEYELIYKENNAPRNIVIILGESVNANHIGLLGYYKDTTPELRLLANKDKNFIYKKAISSSVLTKVSLPMFMNISYNHDDINHILSEKTHLFKLAKQADFKTFYISNQTEAEAGAMAPNYIDVLFTKENYLLDSKKEGDMVLLKKLNEFQDSFKNGKNFIVIHQRNAHSPYENGYKGYDKAAKFDINNVKYYKENSYDNAMVFNDFLISYIFNFFKDRIKIPSFIIFVPDHGEAMGELGKNNNLEFGHAFLSENVANIPIFASIYHSDDLSFLNNIKSINIPTHYELGLELAKLLGYEIKNPNYIKDTFYINGVDITGNAGYIEVLRNIDDIKFIYRE